jgi:tetratricopeptide (TPR) repeat protein
MRLMPVVLLASVTLALVPLALVPLPMVPLAPSVARGEPSSPAAQERRQPPTVATADTEYDRGVRARLVRDWGAAVNAFRGAIALRPDFADAWNELGFALRQQGRYGESIQAYHEALRLRPNFAEALEYLGEAYLKMGRLEEARRVLDRLRPLDTARAEELATEIARAR